MTGFDYLSEVGVALGYVGGGRTSLLPLVVVVVETHRKVILEKASLVHRLYLQGYR